jgi:N-acetylglucosaminyldiphosphoundecaprenol N-acetyl-beta-D-mannosaminyltransferase
LPIDFGRNVHCLLGMPIDMVDIPAALERIRRAAAVRSSCFISTPNLNFLIACQSDAAFRDAVIRSDLNVADGMPLVWLARLLGIPLHERVAGSTLFEALRADAARPLSVYFFGGPEGVAAEACRRLNAEGRGLRCAGFHYPGFGSLDEMSSEEIIERINASGADFLVVALGARKGQKWIVHNLPRLTVPVVSHLGAVVNFVAGTVSRAPRWMQRSGLEWLWRIGEEPGLWRRYWSDGIALLQLLLSCVLPHAFHRRRLPLRNAVPVRLERVEESGAIVLRLAGVWHAGNLAPLRAAFAEVADAPRQLRLDLAGVGDVDSAFVALVLLLHGHRARNGLPFAVVGARGDAARVFRWCRARFVLTDQH